METVTALKAYLVMQKITGDMLEADNKTILVAALGTAIDVWCKEHDEDPIELANLLSNKVREVNIMFGEIGSDRSNLDF